MTTPNDMLYDMAQESKRLPKATTLNPVPPVFEGARPPTSPAEALSAIQSSQEPHWLDRVNSVMSHPEDVVNAVTPYLPSKEDAGRMAVETALSVGGSILAPEVGLPIAAARMAPRIAGAVKALPRLLGAGGGAAAGSLASETFDPTADPVQTALMAGGLGTGAEAITPPLLRPFAGKLIPNAERMSEMLATKDAHLSSASLTESRVLDLAENLGEGSLFSNSLQQAKAHAVTSAQQLADDFISSVSPGFKREEVGSFLQDSIDGSLTAFKRVAAGKFKRVDKLANNITVDLAPVQAKAQRILNEATAGLGEGKTVAQAILDKPDTMTFKEAQLLRSDLLSVGSTSSELVKGKEQGAAKVLGTMIDNMMERAARASNPQALAAFREANTFWRGNINQPGIRDFNSTLVKSLMRSDPDSAVESLLKPNRPTRIHRVRNMIGPSEFEAFRGAALEKMQREATDDVTGLNGAKLVRTIGKYGDATLEELMGPTLLSDYKVLANTLTQAQRKPEFAGATMAARFGQFGAIIDLSTFQMMSPGRDLSILIAPTALNKFLAYPGVARWLSIGLKSEKGSGLAYNTGLRLLSLANQYNIPVQVVNSSGQSTTMPVTVEPRSKALPPVPPPFRQGMPPPMVP